MTAPDGGRVVSTTRVERPLLESDVPAGAEGDAGAGGEPEANDLEAWIAYLGDRVSKVVVMRKRRGAPGQAPYLVTLYEPSSVTLQGIQQKYGGGYFRFTLYGEGGPGAGGILKQPHVEIEGEPITPAAAPPAALAPAAAAPDPMAMALQMATIMSQSVTGMIAPLVEIMKAQQPPPGLDAKDLMKIFRQGVDLGRDGPEAGPYDDVVKHLGGPLLNMLAQGQASPAAAAPALSPPADTATAAVPGARPELPGWAQILAPHVPGLAHLANLRADPVHWAGETADKLPPNQLDALAEHVQHPEFLDELTRCFPELVTHRAWLLAFREALLHELLEEDVADELEGAYDVEDVEDVELVAE